MKVKDDVLGILSELEIDAEAKAVRITAQLDRKTYLQVNKVLAAAGGTWNRKAKAHLFDKDPTSALDTIMMTGEVTTDQDVGFFETPLALAREMVALAEVKKGDWVLEPSAGKGRIVRAICEAGGKACCCERDPERREYLLSGHLDGISIFSERFSPNNEVDYDYKVFPWCDDFMEMELRATPRAGIGYDVVVMNPAFKKVGKGDHLDHVYHAFDEMLRKGGMLVSILPSSVTFRQDRRYREFRDWVDLRGGEIKPLPDDSFKASGTSVRTVLLVVRKPRARVPL